MNNNGFLSRVPIRYWGYSAILLWALAALFLLRRDPYGLDEGAARSLLLIWSIADQVANAVVTFGTPDLRILLFAPAGFLWTGNIFAAKIFTLLLTAWTAWLLCLWNRQRTAAEPALLATGLLLLSPLMLTQLDALAPGVYLLWVFATGAWLHQSYRARPQSFGGNYFAQLFVCALGVSLHPAGLAYPLALLWVWHQEPLDAKHKKYFFTGVGLVTFITLIIRMGWHDADWFHNPVDSLATIFLGAAINGEMTPLRWCAGLVALAMLVVTLARQWKALLKDFMGRTLLLGLALGCATLDATWATIALVVVFYFGLTSLLYEQSSAAENSGRSRSIALAIITVLCTAFMLANKQHYEVRESGLLSDQDQLIRALAEEAEKARQANEDNGAIAHPDLKAASQWPSRTMIACRCDTLPLPPAAENPQTQLAMMRGISWLLLDSQDPANAPLARNLAVLSAGPLETVEFLRGGTLQHLKNDAAPPANPESPHAGSPEPAHSAVQDQKK